MCHTKRHAQSPVQQLLRWLRSIVRLYLAASSSTQNQRASESGVRSQVHEPGISPTGIFHKPAVPGCGPLWRFGSRCGHISLEYEQSIQRPLRSRRVLQSCQPATAHEPLSESNMSSCGARERLRCLCEPHSFGDHQQQPDYGHFCGNHDSSAE